MAEPFYSISSIDFPFPVLSWNCWAYVSVDSGSDQMILLQSRSSFLASLGLTRGKTFVVAFFAFRTQAFTQSRARDVERKTINRILSEGVSLVNVSWSILCSSYPIYTFLSELTSYSGEIHCILFPQSCHSRLYPEHTICLSGNLRKRSWFHPQRTFDRDLLFQVKLRKPRILEVVMYFIFLKGDPANLEGSRRH